MDKKQKEIKTKSRRMKKWIKIQNGKNKKVQNQQREEICDEKNIVPASL